MEEHIERLYKLEAVAERLDVHVETLRRAIRDGKLQAVLIGNRYRVSIDAVAEYLRSQRVEVR